MASTTGAPKSAYAERQQFIDMVHRFEAESKASPARYEARCRSIVRLGYLYLGFIISVLVGILVALVYFMLAAERIQGGVIKLLLIVGIPTIAIIASLFKRLPDEKDGIDLSRQQAPRLWAEVDKLQKALKAPPIHVIRITADWNASASQIPIFGMFGPCKNTLRYGLPLLAAESADETRSTIAHELGHFAGDHSRFSGVVYRVFETWQVAAHHLGGVSSFLLKPFLNWYLPKLWATTFPLRRQSEYAADDAATRLVGAHPNALSLVRLGAQSAKVGEAFTEIYDLVETQPQPPDTAMTRIVNAAKSGMKPEEFDEHLAKSLEEKTTYDDSHPSLTDRLAAIGHGIDPMSFREEVCRPTKPNAADEFLGETLSQDVERGLNVMWAGSMWEAWTMRHQQVAAGAASLRSVETADLGSMPVPTLAKHLSTSLQVRGLEASEHLALAILERDPNHGEANIVMASKCFDTDPDKARAHLEIAARDPETRQSAYSGLSALAEKHGNQNEAAKYYDLAAHEETLDEAFNNEIAKLGPKTAMSAWQPDPHMLELAKQILGETKQAVAAYAVAFGSDVRAGVRHEMLAVLIKYPTFIADEESFVRESLNALGNLPFRFRVVIPNEKALRKALKDVPGALVWGTPP